jgi:uncharacterized protein
MRIALTGASGLIGSHLAAHLRGEGHQVSVLVRRPPRRGTSEIFWDAARGELDGAALEGVDAVVHLAGHSIAGLWTARHRRLVRQSRVAGTRTLASALARLGKKPQVLVSGSAEGFYGHRGDEVLTEESPPGTGFLADVCQEWEAAADDARQAGIRVVHPRIGLVLTARGGALRALLRPFRLGLGGRVGDGRQFWSWISLTDAVRALAYLIQQASLSGPVNTVAPHPARNADFTRALGRALHRPTVFPLPAWLVRVGLGDMGREMLLRSARLEPVKLLRAGFSYAHPNLDEALAAELR